MKIFINVFYFLLLITHIAGYSQNKLKINLSKSNWVFKEIGSIKDWQKASVPGTIHTDLLKTNNIKDPYFRNNEKDIKWVENKDWEYKSVFTVEEDLFLKKNIELVFEGIDTYASVFVNGRFLFSSDNMFRTWKVECKGLLKLGKNEILVKLFSSAKVSKQKYDSLKTKLPNDERVMVRKAQYQFGWDWGPRLVTSGIFKDVFLLAWEDIKINSIQYIQNKITDKKADFTAEIDVYSETSEVFNIEIYDSTNHNTLTTKEINLLKGRNNIKIEFQILNPLLWWTNGLGAPNLYKLTALCYKKNVLLDKNLTKIGIRTVEVIQEKDTKGSSFYFKLNGIPVFMKGANYIPQDNFVPRVSNNQYLQLIKNVANSNMNMLRVWGGGIYENDVFYDLCDEYGILVWQDFMFACAMYPADSSFVSSINHEAIDNVIRLRNHPCIALWCGNNEIDEGWNNWGWQKQFDYNKDDSTRIWNDYDKIFNKTLPDVIKKFDSQRFYWPSSPKIGWGRKESLTQGDSHYWGVWWGEEPFDIYKKKVGRFMSEYGFQAMPDIMTIEKFTILSDRNLDSSVMKAHQKHPIGYEVIKKYMQKSYIIPKDFEQQIYISQLLQAEGIKTAIEAHRRAKPYCMGTLYWQLNDCWPVVSWSGMDYYLNYKAMQYFVKEAFKEVIISVNQENDSIKIYVVSDKLQKMKYRIELSLLDFYGKSISKVFIDTIVDSNSSNIFYADNIQNIIKSNNTNSVFINSKIFSNGEMIDSQNSFFTIPKNLKLLKPKIIYTVRKTDDKIKITFISDVFAKSVYVSCKNHKGKFSNNYFDLLPSEPKEIEFEVSENVNIADLKFATFSLNEVRNE